MSEELTAEQIAQHYSAAMDSVNLINAVVASPDDYANDETTGLLDYRRHDPVY